MSKPRVLTRVINVRKDATMRALFVSTPGIGHVFPMVSLAWALRAAGHEVLVATAGHALVVEKAGLHVVDIVPGMDMAQLIERLREEHPELLEIARNQDLRDLRDAVVLFAAMSGLLVDGVAELAEGWRPDLVVQSQAQGAGLLAAAKLGVPLVDHGFGFARAPGMHELIRQHMAAWFDRHSVAGLPERIATIDVAPPSMLAEGPSGWSMRYVPYNGGGVLPTWLLDRPERPRIAVTLGTVAPMMNGLGPVERIVAAADEVDAEFVLALGDVDISGLGDLPSNVRAAGWVPLSALRRRCAAAVHHGGEGTTMTVLDSGVPQLVLPDGVGRHLPAAAVRDRGVGLVAEEAEVDARLLGHLVHDERLRQAAAEVRAEIAAMPPPADLVPRLVDLAAQT